MSDDKKFKTIILFPSDKNGCGFHRTFVPFNYLASKSNYDCPAMFAFMFDLNYLARADYVRFQRQVTVAQTKIIKEYKRVRDQMQSKAKIVYELDDLVHGIGAHNILAYQFYTKTRRNNLIEIFKMSDIVTFSTQFLKDFYAQNFGINNSVVVPNFLPKFMWNNLGKRDKYNKGKNGKLRIFWAGSSSHVALGGDLEFLVPLIKKTANEFEWVFFGTKPPGLVDLVEFHNWKDFYEYPTAMDEINADIAICPIADTEFNYAKSDLKVLEMSAIGLPCICSAIGNKKGPYDLVPNLMTVENKVDAWYQAIKQMEDPVNRMKYLEAGQTELNNRWLEDPKNTKIYTDIYQ
jgi:glycosyltransferase involved in cell wall biosynthesis